MSSNTDAIRELAQREYKWGFVTDIGEDRAPKGLNEDIIRFVSAKKNEPEFMLEWRLKAYRYWESLEKSHAEPKWANIHYPPIDYQNSSYYSAPKQKPNLKSLDELDPEILRTYEKLGIPLAEQKMLAGVAVDAVFDSVSVATTFKEKLAEVGVIFCSELAPCRCRSSTGLLRAGCNRRFQPDKDGRPSLQRRKHRGSVFRRRVQPGSEGIV